MWWYSRGSFLTCEPTYFRVQPHIVTKPIIPCVSNWFVPVYLRFVVLEETKTKNTWTKKIEIRRKWYILRCRTFVARWYSGWVTRTWLAFFAYYPKTFVVVRLFSNSCFLALTRFPFDIWTGTRRYARRVIRSRATVVHD